MNHVHTLAKFMRKPSTGSAPCMKKLSASSMKVISERERSRDREETISFLGQTLDTAIKESMTTIAIMVRESISGQMKTGIEAASWWIKDMVLDVSLMVNQVTVIWVGIRKELDMDLACK